MHTTIFQSTPCAGRHYPEALLGQIVEVPWTDAPEGCRSRYRASNGMVPAVVVNVLADNTLVLQFFGYPEPQEFTWRAAEVFTVATCHDPSYFPAVHNRPQAEIPGWGTLRDFDEYDAWSFGLNASRRIS